MTGGVLKVKDALSGGPEGEGWSGKADQLRLYSGAKYTLAGEVLPGQVCAVTGLTGAKPGEGLGAERDAGAPLLEPVLTYQVLLPAGADVHTALAQLRRIEEEVPELHVVWDEALGQIHIRLMGEIQLEVLQSLLSRRFGLEVSFGEGGILYKETIAGPVEGGGPLRAPAPLRRGPPQTGAPCPPAAASSTTPTAGRKCWPATGSGWSCPTWKKRSTGAS